MSKSTLKIKPIAITPGEPAGCGPDVVLSLLQHNLIKTPITLIADRNMLDERANLLGYQQALSHPLCNIQHVTCPKKITPGYADSANADYLLRTLTLACHGCLQGDFHAMVTGPINKSVINEAGIAFSGHTEYLAQLSQTARTVMVLMSAQLKVALLTTHIALKQVFSQVTSHNIVETVAIIQHDLQQRFSIEKPRIHICGLNPHAGEQGTLGLEEQHSIIPAIQQCQQQGIDCHGPFAADTAFTKDMRQRCDITLAMYHDQGLTAIKTLDFANAVNITFGLPFIRTSVDHGTAFDLAGTGKATHSSLLQAITLAAQLHRGRQHA